MLTQIAKKTYNESLDDFSLKDSLAYLNIILQKKEGRLWTYTFPNNAQVNYILMKKRINSALNCEENSTFKVISFHHRIILPKIRSSLNKIKKWMVRITHYYWFLLTNCYIRNKFSVTVRNKLNTLQEKFETYTPNDVYKNFIIALIKAAAECAFLPNQEQNLVSWKSIIVFKKKRWSEKSIPT